MPWSTTNNNIRNERLSRRVEPEFQRSVKRLFRPMVCEITSDNALFLHHLIEPTWVRVGTIDRLVVLEQSQLRKENKLFVMWC